MEEDRRSREHARGRSAGELITTSLSSLATAHGVDTGYEDDEGVWRPAPTASVRAALRVMGIPCDTDEEVARALREVEEEQWRELVPACTVLREHEARTLTLHPPPGARVTALLRTEAGEVRDLPPPVAQTGEVVTLRDGDERVAALLDLPSELTLGYHEVEASVLASDGAVASRGTGHVIVVPPACPGRDHVGRSWGWMLQLYALRSERSWGMGDLRDLEELLRWGAGIGADFALINPLHAAAPVLPQESSPYYPSSRRFVNPIYLAMPEPSRLPSNGGMESARRAGERARSGNREDHIDRDRVFAAKSAALEATFAELEPAEVADLDAFRRGEGEALEDFATFCVLAEEHGLPFQDWPTGLRHPRSAEVAAFRAERGDRIAYHCWLQQLCDEQLRAMQESAIAAGASLGVIHDLAVGVDKGGADAWALQDDLALGVSVGAPPDAFNQQGQDWQQPPLLPNRLRLTGYAPFREMLAAVLRHAGGIRIDHVLGLFRIFWIPEGSSPVDGTYVRYPTSDMLGILALEATRAGAIVIGEDLGTVAPGVREALADQQVLSSSVLYFERDPHADRPRRSADYRADTLASVTTHDLPTAAGWWSGVDVELRVELGLLGEGSSPAGERAQKREAIGEMEQLLRDEGLLGDDPGLDERIEAMHAFLARTPARLVAVNVADVVGDERQPNMPGTVDEYPNWRLPIAEPSADGHTPILLEALERHPGVTRLREALRARTTPAEA